MAENCSRWCLVKVGKRKKGLSLTFVSLSLQHFPPSVCSDSLWLQVAPSHPSLQTQRKELPCTVHVPPFSQGFGRQLLFRAATHKHRHYDVGNAAFTSSASTEFTSTIGRQKRGNKNTTQPAETDPLHKCLPPSWRRTHTGTRRHVHGRSLRSDKWRRHTGSLLTINNNFDQHVKREDKIIFGHTHLLEWQVLPFQSSKHWQ